MLKKKLRKGNVVGLSCELVSGGVLLTLDEQPADPNAARLQRSFLMNPAQVSKFIDGLVKGFADIRAQNGDELLFHNPPLWDRQPINIAIRPGSVDEHMIIFPLHDHEVSLIRKALEDMASNLLFVGTWSGEAEEW